MRFYLFISIFFTLLAFTLAQGSTNATFVAEEIASISPCGVSTTKERKTG